MDRYCTTGDKARASLCAALALLALGAWPWTDGLAAMPEATLRARHATIIELGRTGNLDQALEAMAALRAEHPDDPALRHDEIVLLSWAGQDRQAVDRSTGMDPATTPYYAGVAVAKAARNLQDFDSAIAWYQAALASEPRSLDARCGLAMSLADASRHAEARSILDAAEAGQRTDDTFLLASAYLHERNEQWPRALTDYDAVLARNGSHRDALRGKALALRGLLLPGPALAIARAHPGLLSAAEIAGLEADELAIEVRDAIQNPAPAGDPFGPMDRALARLDERLAREPADGPVRRRLRYDRTVALVERQRAAEAALEYEALLAEDPALPAYVHAAAGRGYLQLRRPDDALAALREAERLAPGDIEVRMELFYAHTELEDYDAALALADGLVRDLTRPGPARMRAEIMAGIGRAYADDLAASQARLEALVDEAPSNPDARQELGNVYRWRGWSDRAAAQFASVLTVSPDLLYPRIGYAHAELDRQEFPVGEAELRGLQDRYGDHRALADLDRRWTLHNRNQVRVEGRWGESSGQTFGSDQYDIDAWWYSPPIKYNFRLFAHTFDSQAEFDFGDVDRRRAGAGLEYRGGRWAASAEFSADRDGFDRGGVAGRVDYRASDVWSFGGLVELDSYATPLRAYDADIDSNLAGLDALYRRHESLSLYAGTRFQDFSDGNERVSLFADGHWRFISGPRYKLDLTGGLYTSSNSLADAVYFNPERDFETTVGLDNRWRMFRHYDHSLQHRLHGRAGVYDQDGFGSDQIWSLDYELTWSVNDALEVRLGWHRGRRVYDGAPEYQTFYLAGVDGRF